MTVGKDQAKPTILNAVLLLGPFRQASLRFEISHELSLPNSISLCLHLFDNSDQ